MNYKETFLTKLVKLILPTNTDQIMTALQQIAPQDNAQRPIAQSSLGERQTPSSALKFTLIIALIGI